jgi:hypothetical protein
MFGIQTDGTYRVENIGYSVAELTTGYVVGVRAIQRETDIPTEGTLFGRWTDDDGTVYWDQVEIIADRSMALHVAANRGELAIWDVAYGKAVEVPR